MEQEFGLKSDGDIDVRFTFTVGMEEDLPKNRIIEITCGDEIGEYWWFLNNGNYYLISEEMIKEHNPNPLKKLMKNNIFKKTATLDEI